MSALVAAWTEGERAAAAETAGALADAAAFVATLAERHGNDAL